MLGFFEAENEPQPIAELLRTGTDWLRERGVGDIVGPIDGDTWHRYRLNVGPFDRPPFLMEPFNPPYYPDLWRQAGFVPLETYYSKRIDNVLAAHRELQSILDRVVRRGYSLRCLNPRCFEEELTLLHKLSSEIFAENFLYEPISLDDFLAMYVPMRSVVDRDLVRFAISPEGEPVGFIFSVVDYHQAVKAMRGKHTLWAKLRFMMHRHQADAVNIKSMGVLPGHRRSGLGAALMCQAYRDTLAKGFQKVNLCLIRDDNPSGRLDGGQGEILRRLSHSTNIRLKHSMESSNVNVVRYLSQSRSKGRLAAGTR